MEIVKSLGEAYDLIFMDGPKGQYINMNEDIKRLLPPGGVLISDNILQDGDILESRYAVTRRDRTIHSRMRDYLYKLTHHEDYSTSIGQVVVSNQEIRELLDLAASLKAQKKAGITHRFCEGKNITRPTFMLIIKTSRLHLKSQLVSS